MQLIKWKTVTRKRIRGISHNDPEYVRGYDLDTGDFSRLVDTFNERDLTGPEERQLMDYALTMVAIILENPKISYSNGEFDGLTDMIFFDVWRSFKYIRQGTNPYSYAYRAGFGGAMTYFGKKIRTREKEAAIQAHIGEVYEDYVAEQNAGRQDPAGQQE